MTLAPETAPATTGRPLTAEEAGWIYRRLFGAMGPQHWWPAETPFEVIVGAILTQSTSWVAVEKAIAGLKAEGGMTPVGLWRMPDTRLRELIRPCGYFNAKAKKLRAFLEMLFGEFGGDLDALFALETGALREKLLATHGFGPETADAVVLYAANKPSFVIDAYTRRVLGRMGVAVHPDTYEGWRAAFEAVLPPDVRYWNELHALIDEHAATVCRKRQPACATCVLRPRCDTGRAVVEGLAGGVV
jgi:endonuclease-3 related protein